MGSEIKATEEVNMKTSCGLENSGQSCLDNPDRVDQLDELPYLPKGEPIPIQVIPYNKG